ncbi:NACHT and WD40 domain-containing protein [Histoplasma capsulatum var. duboisii H88]|uniref:NACHT and WD40 domain-containing protein n=2 Tax=Ajellomyces capsulatus TaxID=5037 RepID=F0UI28_AJEC8|nr:NACHT and WD40 domain-containing protein [Histoplasma capsulatum H143]EGC46333.1 NACHT and WD40 domain-containing protein [Histoplasma capsulatum var. duboisii H88]
MEQGHAVRMVIVIDALDECEREDDVRDILRLLPRAQELNSVQVRLRFKDIADDHQDFILHEIPDSVIKQHRGVIGTIIILESPLPVASLSRLTGISKESIHVRLKLLHSVLSISNDKTKPIRPFHLSFRDFLLHPDTPEKTPLWIDEKETHQTLTVQCLKVMQHKLRKNICNLPGDGTERGGVDLNSVSHHLSPELHYACRYWAQHLIQSQEPITEMVNAFSFLKLHFLHWVEAMSILVIISEVVKIINTL